MLVVGCYATHSLPFT